MGLVSNDFGDKPNLNESFLRKNSINQITTGSSSIHAI
ncbi:hypothetical protein KIS1582_3219 [Cytobacillus firmus]|uniref:Uncharacterized protein n=1 Tax=Cytobacillus firmus TaxID=1399 RepID=A0A800MVC2_CYTFI|nr:hypothetical protein KIS1582_3219 [Cytobacillus firmus]